jgi:predicted alpha/beta hydrolase
MPEERVQLRALDGYPLEGLLVQPEGQPRAAIVLNSGTGIPKEFYRRFAGYAAGRGYAVLLYDYRGIGGSRPAGLRGFAATMRGWGEQDMPGALGWLHARFAGLPLFAVGHSVGGQLLGLMPNYGLLSGAAMVTVSSGHWGGMPRWFGLYTLLVWYGLAPLTTATLGYLPAKRFRFGEDLPAGVAREWRDWCLSPRYMADFLGKTIARHYYDEFRAPLLWLSFSDDPISTARNVPTIQALYRAASIDDRRIAPADVGLGTIGHLGFFRAQSRERLWPLPLDWFEREPGIAGG